MKDKDKTKEQLINELEQMHQRVVEFEGSATIDKRTKEDEKYMRNLAFLSRTSIGFLELSPEEDIYEFIGRQLRELVGNSIILVSSFEGATDNACVRAVLGVGKKMGSAVRILGRHPVGMSLPIDDEARLGLGSGKLVKVPGGLYEFSFRRIPRTVCRAIEKLLDLGDIYAMGFVWKGELFGSASILTRKGTQLGEQILIETFIKQASVVLQRRQVEQALQKAHNELEIRVQERTQELAKINEQLCAEIVERKQAEEAMKENEEKLQRMFEFATDGIVVTDLNGNIMEMNEAAVRLRGSDSKEKLIGRSTFELIAEKDRVRIMETLKSALEDGQIRRDVEITFLTEDGREYLAEVSSALLRDAAGNSVGFIAIFRDITERKQAEEALRQSEEKFKTILENTRDMVFQLSPLGIIQYVSPKVEEVYGYKPEDLIGKHLKKTTPVSELPKALKALKSVLSGKVINNFEINQVDADGKIIPVEINITPVRRGGKIIAAQGVMRDITERKRAEEQTRQLQEYLRLQIDRMPIGLIVWDIEFRVQSWNPAAGKIFGFTAEEALGKHPYDFIVPKETQPHVDDIWRRLLAGDMTAYSINENITKDGRTLICEWSNTPLKEADGTVVGVLSMVQDITERKQAEEALRESEEKYRKIVGNVHDMVYSCYPDGTLYFVSSNVLSLAGYKPEEGIGRNLVEFVHPDDRERVLADFEKTIKTGEEFPTVFRFSRKDGSYFYAEELGRVIREGGKLVGVTGVIRDITERRRAEEALRESEEKYRAFFRTSRDCVFITTKDGRWIDFNDATVELLGYENSDELRKVRIPELYEKPEKRERITRAIEQQGFAKDLAVNFRKKDGSIINILITAVVNKDESGNVIGYQGTFTDITERKRAEETLRKSQEHAQFLANVLESSSQPFAVGYPDGRLRTFNTAYCELLGYNRGELHELKWDTELTPPEWQKVVAKAAEEIIRTRQPQRFEKEYIRKDGSRIPVEVFVNPIFDSKGDLEYFFSFFTDITERKQAEEALRESERRFKDIAENASEWVWETDVNGKYIYASPVCEKILGYKPEELFEKHFYDLFLPEEREQLKKAAFETFVKKQSFREFINPNVHKNGEIVWLSTSGVPILDERGNLLGYRGADIDITERKQAEEALRQSEEKLKTILENTSDMVFQLSPLGVIQYVSPQVKDLYGYEPEDLIGKHFKKTTPVSELPKALKVLKTVLSGKVINNFEINQVDADGKIIPVEINATPVRKGGKIIAAQGVMRDITERKRMEKELRELYEVEKSQREELEEEVKARGLLINALAHELRTPLTPILASAGILKENLSSSPETDEFKLASNILMGTELLTSRLEEFLIFAKFTSGAFSLKTQLIDTREFIKGVALQLMSAGDEGEQRFILELPQNLPKIEADPSYLQQVVTILLSNATKFSSKGENVTLRAKTESGELVVEVEAKGVGMSAKEQHRILRPYHRTEQDRQRFPGLGLGIAVSKRIIEAHGGKMWLSSKLGKGTTFSFSLPLRSEERKPRH